MFGDIGKVFPMDTYSSIDTPLSTKMLSWQCVCEPGQIDKIIIFQKKTPIFKNCPGSQSYFAWKFKLHHCQKLCFLFHIFTCKEWKKSASGNGSPNFKFALVYDYKVLCWVHIYGFPQEFIIVFVVLKFFLTVLLCQSTNGRVDH